MENENLKTSCPDIPSDIQQQEDAALKTCMQFFADELLPYLGIDGHVSAFGPTELVHLDLKKLFQDFNLIMEDGTWKHFEFQSTNEGLAGLKLFRAYEALTSYQYKVSIETYVLYSGTIRNPMTEFTEGLNTYRIIPIIMRNNDADELIRGLQEKQENNQALTKSDLVPLTLCPLMGGKSSLKERIMASYAILRNVNNLNADDLQKIEAVIYAMADKYLESAELKQIMEDISMTRLGRMLIEKGMTQGIEQGAEQNKLENARNLIGLLDEQIIAERIGLPIETVQQLKQEIQNK